MSEIIKPIEINIHDSWEGIKKLKRDVKQLEQNYETIFKTLIRIMDCLEENNMDYHYGEQILEEIYNLPYEQIRNLEGKQMTRDEKEISKAGITGAKAGEKLKQKLKTEYKYIKFVKMEDNPKTSVYVCYNKKSSIQIGIVKWYPYWRQYCFFPGSGTIFSKGCLEDVNDFISAISF